LGATELEDNGFVFSLGRSRKGGGEFFVQGEGIGSLCRRCGVSVMDRGDKNMNVFGGMGSIVVCDQSGENSSGGLSGA